MCNATTFTGSIGVIISTLNYRELFGKIGLQSVVFKSGKFKDMLNGAREMTPEEQAYIAEPGHAELRSLRGHRRAGAQAR